MAANWGVFETWPEKDTTELHVVPMVDLGDGESVMSAAHVLDPECRCGCIWSINEYGVKVWAHHDADHAGALSEDEWLAKKAAA